MKIFITGGTGNIGQYVMRELLDRGHSVKALTRDPNRIPEYLDVENLEMVKGSLNDFDVIEKAIAGCDAVIHIALGWGNDPVNMLINDTKVTAFLLDVSERLGVSKFLYTSSTAAQGNMFDGIDETCINKPTDLYGSTKAAAEMYIIGFKQYYSAQGGYGEAVKMKRNIIRPGYTYSNPIVPHGASQSDKRFYNIAEKIINNEDMTFNINDGTQFLSSAQIAKVYAAVIESDMNEEIFYALGKNSITWYEIALEAKKMVPESTSTITAEGEKEAPRLYNVNKIKENFGLEFDSWEDIRDHIRWNLEAAKKVKAGEKLYNTNHEYT